MGADGEYDIRFEKFPIPGDAPPVPVFLLSNYQSRCIQVIMAAVGESDICFEKFQTPSDAPTIPLFFVVQPSN